MPTFIVANNPGFKNPITLSSKDEHHLIRVMRTKVGESVTLTDNHGNIATAKLISEIPPKFTISEIKKAEAPSPFTLCLPLIKPERLEWAIEKLCELNIEAVQLIITEFTQYQQLPPAKLQRLVNAAVTAQKQCGRATPLKVLPPVKLSELVFEDTAEIIVATLDSSIAKSQPKSKGTSKTYLVIGPEGGLSDADLEHLNKSSIQKIYFGETILRAETAAVILVGLWKWRSLANPVVA